MKTGAIVNYSVVLRLEHKLLAANLMTDDEKRALRKVIEFYSYTNIKELRE